MLFPKKVKHRKWQTMRKRSEKLGNETRGTTLSFGAFGIKTVTAARIRSEQIEAARRAISRSVTKAGRVWIRIFPDRPYTAKAAEVGMGKGKGDLKGYEFQARPGRILFEVDGVSEAIAREALRKGTAKLPVKTKFIVRG